MVDISSQNNKINVTVSSSGNTANTNVTPDYAQYYSEKSKEWAISDKIVDNTDYSSKYYANESKKQADISTAKTTEVIESGNTAVSNIENARNNAITDITNQESLSVDNINTAGATQVSSVNTAGMTQVANVNSAGTTQINLAKEQVTLATEQANIATQQATIATNKTSEVVASGNEALSSIDTAKNNAITSITNQETTSRNVLIDEGATQIGLIQNEGATQVANVQSTGFYMRDDKLYYINSQGEETEFKSGGSGLEICDIGMALYIDETKGLRRYLNGQIVDINTNTQAFLDRLKQITNLHPSLLCTENEWQTAKTMSAFGQVGKFVFNYSGENIVSVRLPRVVNVQGLFDLQNLGMTVEAGLPNITGSIGRMWGEGAYTGALYRSDQFYTPWVGPQNAGVGTTINIDASRSSSVYGKSNTVQQEAIQYPYFIQIATGAETENNIINEIELNNPYSLFDSKYSDHELNNLSWLKSEGQWNAKAVYTDAYDKLLNVYNGTETVEGLSVKLSTEEYTDYDFVLNTVEETFRLPLLNGSEDLPTGEIISQTIPSTNTNTYYQIDYNCFVTITLENCTHCRLWDNTQKRETWITGAAGYQGKTLFMPKGHQLGVYYQNGTMTKFIFQKAKGNGTLYFYVGETVQNANLIDAGRIGEQLATKTDMQQAAKASMPSSRYINLTLGATGSTYTAPANGYFTLNKLCGVSSGNGYIVLQVNNKSIEANPAVYNSPGAILRDFVPVQKNDVVTVSYNATGKTNYFRFIYAEGEV